MEKYNDTIDDIKIEMDEATKSGDSIRLDIRELRSRFVIFFVLRTKKKVILTFLENRFALVNAADRCYCCNYPLYMRSFYMFPCQHGFHGDCLTDKVRFRLFIFFKKKQTKSKTLTSFSFRRCIRYYLLEI